MALAFAMAARAQDDGARVYQLAPVGFQTFTAFVVNKRGDEGPDPGQTNPGSDTRSGVLVLRYARTFDLVGRQFTPFAILPMGRLTVTQGAGLGDTSSGLGDAQLGATLGLFGAPALDRAAYAEYRPVFSMSLLGRVFLPTGAYSGEQPVNLGANRFSYQLGLPTTFMFGQSFRDPHLTALEVMPTVTFYGANDEPFGADRAPRRRCSAWRRTSPTTSRPRSGFRPICSTATAATAAPTASTTMIRYMAGQPAGRLFSR